MSLKFEGLRTRRNDAALAPGPEFANSFTRWFANVPVDQWRENLEHKRAGAERWAQMNWDADFAGLPPIKLPDGRELETDRPLEPPRTMREGRSRTRIGAERASERKSGGRGLGPA